MSLGVPAFCAEPTPGPSPTHDRYGWVPTGHRDGILTFKRNVPGTKLLAFKGEGVVEAPLAKVFQVLFDTTRATEWIADLKECRVVRKISDLEFLEYDRAGTPPIIMKDRDFLSRVTIEPKPREKTLVMRYEPAEDPAAPPARKYIRGELKSCVYVLTAIDGGARTEISAEVLCDPKGSVPKWLVNWFQGSWPRDTFVHMRRQAAKTDIADWAPYETLMGPSASVEGPKDR